MFNFMQPGQILVNKDGEKRKVLFASEDLIIPSKIGNFDMASSNFTKKELREFGWFLLEEPWVPSLSEPYWFLDSDGGHSCSNWGIDGMEQHNFRLSIGNVYKVENDLELYKQKLIERMGKK